MALALPETALIRPETITRLRNAFALIALESQDSSGSDAGAASSALPFSTMTEESWRAAVRLWRAHAGTLLDTVPDRPCPACGAATSRKLFDSYDAHPFHECLVCGCWFEPKLVDGALFARLFARSPEARALAEEMVSARDFDAGRDADMARVGQYLDDLAPLLPARDGRPFSYLDAGCGVGHSLRAGLERGWTVQGVEVDRTAVTLARRAGLPVATLEDPLPPGPYDLLSFWETLEHIADPLSVLTRVLPLLAPDGLVAITVPNLNALATRTLREACPWVHGGYNTPGHVNLFHQPALERLLDRAGLTLVDADGQFSGNPIELAAYLHGATRGAFDTLDPSMPRGTLPERLGEILSGVWPGAALVERLTMASPILRVVACRRGHEPRLAPAIAACRESRRRRLAEEALALLAEEPDYQSIAAALQREVDRRDELLARTVSGLQHEVDRRDALITERDFLLAEKVNQMQLEINSRDALLDAARARFERTVDGRAIAGRRALGRIARRFGMRR